MPADIVREGDPALEFGARKTTPAAALAALGIVYGDLGTSPLYTLQAVVRTAVSKWKQPSPSYSAAFEFELTGVAQSIEHA